MIIIRSTSVSVPHYHRDKPVLTDAGAIDDFPDNSASFKVKQNIAGKTGNNCTKMFK